MTDGTGEPDVPALMIHCALDADAHTVRPDDGPVTIGRIPPARILVNDPRISSKHARIDALSGHWVLTDLGSTNGTYVDGHRIGVTAITDGMTVHLGNADGIPVSFTSIADADPVDDPEDDPVDAVDERLLRAGQAVAERRRELGLSQRDLLALGVAKSQGTLVNFENGRTWPRKSSRARLEEVLKWPPGTIAAIVAGESGAQPVGGEPADDNTEVLSNTVEMQLVVDAAEIGLHGINARILTLPGLHDPGYADQVGELLSELRRLESMISRATLAATAGADLAVLLSEVRRAHTDLMGRAAKAPGAPLGPRLYTARHRSELRVDEIAAAAGVDARIVTAAEADQAVDAAAAAALESVIATLTRHWSA
ncbi:FHA domain-containing protein [Mycolicibacterium arseniciresistens]|uniref:FHA domain-containing protein n=1 Tax=Mycolicibacterium arseniciresistens TaxID=3062257 RepID=A0ABT8UPN1_9MYCO|nr:FHA domain-containing protein [Mycolicibacterium arseniciresistens]MDO3638129.1 FHA domain-containing protein [Mycolicibacterium arseniciresistens]